MNDATSIVMLKALSRIKTATQINKHMIGTLLGRFAYLFSMSLVLGVLVRGSVGYETVFP